MQANKALHVALNSTQLNHLGVLAGAAKTRFLWEWINICGPHTSPQPVYVSGVGCQKSTATIFSWHRNLFASVKVSCIVLSIDAARVVPQPCQTHAVLQRQYAFSTCVTVKT